MIQAHRLIERTRYLLAETESFPQTQEVEKRQGYGGKDEVNVVRRLLELDAQHVRVGDPPREPTTLLYHLGLRFKQRWNHWH